MVCQELIDRVVSQVLGHCESKRYFKGQSLNPLEPHDPVAAWQMARMLTTRDLFDHFVAVAPEGHVYGYFFEQLGVKLLSVTVGYPPREAETSDDLSVIAGGRVLVIEDDVISGVTLQLVLSRLLDEGPRGVSLYLGRVKEDQRVSAIPPGITDVYLAEDCLDPRRRANDEREFTDFFAHRTK